MVLYSDVSKIADAAVSFGVLDVILGSIPVGFSIVLRVDCEGVDSQQGSIVSVRAHTKQDFGPERSRSRYCVRNAYQS